MEVGWAIKASQPTGWLNAPRGGEVSGCQGILESGGDGACLGSPGALTQPFLLAPSWASHTSGTPSLSPPPYPLLRSLVLGRSRPGQPSRAFPASLHPAGDRQPARPLPGRPAPGQGGRDTETASPRQAPILPTRGNRTLSRL